MWSRLKKRSLSLGSFKSEKSNKEDAVKTKEENEELEEKNSETSENTASEPPGEIIPPRNAIGKILFRKLKSGSLLSDKKQSDLDQDEIKAEEVSRPRSRSLTKRLFGKAESEAERATEPLRRTSSLSRLMFSRKGSESSITSRPRSFSNPFRSKSKSESSIQMDSEISDEVKEQTGISKNIADEPKKRRSFSKRAKKLLKKLNILKVLKKKSSFRMSSSKNDGPVQSLVKKKETISAYDPIFLQFFSSNEWKRLSALESETSYTRFESVFGHSGNLMLLSHLSEMAPTFEKFLQAMVLLQSPDKTQRLQMMYHMHSLGNGNLCRDDLRRILRSPLLLDPSIKRRKLPADLSDEDRSMINVLRLEVFYATHCPSKLFKVQDIIEKYQGKEDVLWKKLNNQYQGFSVPSDVQVIPLLATVSVVNELVEEIFNNKDTMNLNEFCSWYEDNPGTIGAKPITTWHHAFQGEPYKRQSISGWVRIAFNEENETKLSEMKWRRRWCNIAENEDGSCSLHVSKEQHDTAFQIIDLLNEDIEVVERHSHKHTHTLLVGTQLMLQVSRATSQSFEEWFKTCKASTYKMEITKSIFLNPHVLEKRLAAFFILHNPEKVEKVPDIIKKYQGKEEKLIRSLEKQYEGETIPSFDDALDIIARAVNSNTELTVQEKLNKVKLKSHTTVVHDDSESSSGSEFDNDTNKSSDFDEDDAHSTGDEMISRSSFNSSRLDETGELNDSSVYEQVSEKLESEESSDSELLEEETSFGESTREEIDILENDEDDDDEEEMLEDFSD